MNDDSPTAWFIRRFEIIVVLAVQLLLVAGLTIATVELFVLFFDAVKANITHIESVPKLQVMIGKLFSGAMVVLLGLELIETLKAYFVQHHVRTELILTVALIAVGRHVIQIDLDQVTGAQLGGLAALISSLALGYFVIRRSHSDSRPSQPPAVEHS
jgi:uncharacterized membrane protein (DUF373 family)